MNKYAQTYRKATRAWKQANPEAALAHQYVRLALHFGDLKKPDACELCGKSGMKLVGHHYDYRRPLQVYWVCLSCHGILTEKYLVEDASPEEIAKALAAP
jgi:hypothetical protein